MRECVRGSLTCDFPLHDQIMQNDGVLGHTDGAKPILQGECEWFRKGERKIQLKKERNS